MLIANVKARAVRVARVRGVEGDKLQRGYFTIDSLPERYRSQVQSQIYGDFDCTNQSSRQLPRKSLPSLTTKRKPHSTASPIRMPKPKVMSSAEILFNNSFLNGNGSGRYEALTLNLPGKVKYTPDFVVTTSVGTVLIEVKGDYRLHSQSRAAMAFKTACAAFPEFVFLWAEKQPNSIALWKIATFKAGAPIFDTFVGSADEFLSLPNCPIIPSPQNQ